MKKIKKKKKEEENEFYKLVVAFESEEFEHD